MTREQAKEILSGYRPGGGDDGDPFFTEALNLLKADAELAAWFKEQQSFDRAVARACQPGDAPEDLRALILGQQRHKNWWNRPLRGAELAMAASIALLLTIGGFWHFGRDSHDFISLRERFVQQTWSGQQHVKLETSSLAEIRRFIAANDVPADFKLPPEIAAMRPRGCSLVSVEGHRVPFICFNDGAKHLHLIVMNHTGLRDAPIAGKPDFSKIKSLTTATWSQGDTTFVLTGMRTADFVKKFRKERQWTWGG